MRAIDFCDARFSALIWIADALDGDPEMEPDADDEDDDEDCCGADDDTGTRYRNDTDRLGCPRWGGSGGSDDDAEPAPSPGFLDRFGRWRGKTLRA